MRKRCFVAMILSCILPAVVVARGDTVTYIVDPSQSSLTISGTYEGDPLQPQPGVPDSLTTPYAGTITVDRDFSAGTLQITGASITAQTSDASSPTTSAPADYGFSGITADAPIAVFNGAIVGLSWSLSSQLIASPSGFDASVLSATPASDHIVFTGHVEGTGGSEIATLEFSSPVSLDSANATLTDANGLESLFIPFSVGPFVATDISDNEPFPLDLNFSGAIVGTSPVPEPASLAMLGIPALLLLHRNFKETP